MQKYSYERILSAVGRVLDDAEARSFSIRDAEDGLQIELVGAPYEQRLVLNLNITDVAELVELKSGASEQPHFERSYAHDDNTLQHFLASHKLVGAGR